MKQRFLADDDVDACVGQWDPQNVAVDDANVVLEPDTARQVLSSFHPCESQFYAGDIGPVPVSQVARRAAQASAEVDDARAFHDTGALRQHVIGVQPAVVILVVWKQFGRLDVVEMTSICTELGENDFE
jgi:hypothetical protein